MVSSPHASQLRLFTYRIVKYLFTSGIIPNTLYYTWYFENPFYNIKTYFATFPILQERPSQTDPVLGSYLPPQ
jgi:hypothetical protein